MRLRPSGNEWMSRSASAVGACVAGPFVVCSHHTALLLRRAASDCSIANTGVGKPPLGLNVRFGGCVVTVYRSRLNVKDSRPVPRRARLEDGVSFIHVFIEHDDVAVPDSLQVLLSFNAFVAGIAERCARPPTRHAGPAMPIRVPSGSVK
jgi:hypothetical protein